MGCCQLPLVPLTNVSPPQQLESPESMPVQSLSRPARGASRRTGDEPSPTSQDGIASPGPCSVSALMCHASAWLRGIEPAGPSPGCFSASVRGSCLLSRCHLNVTSWVRATPGRRPLVTKGHSVRVMGRIHGVRQSYPFDGCFPTGLWVLVICKGPLHNRDVTSRLAV